MKTLLQERARVSAQHRNDIAIEGLELLVAELALLGPTLLLCIVMAQVWPLYMMAGIQILGVMLGFVKFTNPTDGSKSCVPSTKRPRKRSKPRMIDWKTFA